MSFTEIQKTRNVNIKEPFIKLAVRNRIVFNSAFCIVHEITEDHYVTVFADKQNKKIAFYFHTDADGNSYSLRTDGSKHGLYAQSIDFEPFRTMMPTGSYTVKSEKIKNKDCYVIG